MQKNVLIVGTGTIGEPLIGLLADHKEELGIDKVKFFKRTPLSDEKGKIESLIRKGGEIVSTKDVISDFKSLGFKDIEDVEKSYEDCQVIIDCTPKGNENWKNIYSNLDSNKRYLAQGSEHGFGEFYAWGINNKVFNDNNRYLIASCNTHNIASLIKTFVIDQNRELDKGTFVCLRRANDVSQDSSFTPSPTITLHDDLNYGTHHARDVFELFSQENYKFNLFSSAIKLPTQYMHTLWFNLNFQEAVELIEIEKNLTNSKDLTSTEKLSSNKVFSFGRDHGYHGRLLSHGIVAKKSLHVKEKSLTGYCFTPQDGNALLSSVAATVQYFYPEDWEKRLSIFNSYIFNEI
tara:strand:+ start:1635 stop:2678 length:1044 start_codon:yes stop_codon:yes gene_type:complete